MVEVWTDPTLTPKLQPMAEVMSRQVTMVTVVGSMVAMVLVVFRLVTMVPVTMVPVAMVIVTRLVAMVAKDTLVRVAAMVTKDILVNSWADTEEPRSGSPPRIFWSIRRQILRCQEVDHLDSAELTILTLNILTNRLCINSFIQSTLDI